MKVEISDDKHFVELCAVRLGNTFLHAGDLYIRTYNSPWTQDGLYRGVNLATGASVAFLADQSVRPIRCKVVEDIP